jgi:hypothetical protein
MPPMSNEPTITNHSSTPRPSVPVGAAPPPGFLQNPTVQVVLPWLTSIAFHAAIVILAIILIRSIPAIRKLIVVEQVIIPDTNLVDAPDAGGVPNPGINNAPDRKAMQDVDPSVTESNDVFNKKSDTLAAAINEGSADLQSNFTPIGFAGKSSGTNTGLKKKGLGDGGGGLAAFGEPGGGGGGLFKGTGRRDGGNVRKVVYVCDASGSMDTNKVWDVLIDQLRKSIDGLGASQSFNLIFFQAGAPVIVNKEGLMRSTKATRQRSYDAIKKVSRAGQTNPIPALREAFRQDPELIQLLTDAEFTGDASSDDVVRTIRQLNAERVAAGRQKISVNTYLLVSNELTEAERAPMKQIAEENNGRFYYVKVDDLFN